MVDMIVTLPRADCLTRMKDMVKPNGYLVITTPFSWLDEFTARENWLGGYEGKVSPLY